MTPDLNALKDIHLPPPVSAWPPAPGWVVSALTILIVSIIVAWVLKGLLNKIRFRKSIFKTLEDIEENYLNKRLTGNQACYQLSTLLKQVLMKNHAREEIASISGNAWVARLDNEPFAKIIAENEYKKHCQVDLKPFFDTIKKFIKKKL